jgi:hypothetical protein
MPKRSETRRLTDLATRVDRLMSDGPPTLTLGDIEIMGRTEEEAMQQANEYLQNVERAASDLGTGRVRERVLDEVLASVFAESTSITVL